MLLERAGQSLRRLTRSIHIPSHVVPPVPRSRTLFARLVTQLHGLTLQASHISHTPPSIRQSLSLPSRIALSRPLRAPCLPRAPRVPANVTQVGLGTARKFSTGRPIFQHLADNVPVAGRAFYEAEWDLRLRQEKNTKIRRPKKTKLKVKVADKLTSSFEPIAATPINEEVHHYFQTPFTPLVATYLQIPLAPTPTSRVPLSLSPDAPRLLPLPALAKQHASHSKHAIRVSSLFRRLDAARVWQRGASCESFGDPSGLCTILRIKFEGWSEEMVKGVLGDAGKDWCAIQEVPSASDVPRDSIQTMSPEPRSTENSPSSGISFVMPALDFSSSFVSASPPSSWSSLASSPMSLSDGDSDYSFPPNSEVARDDDSSSDELSLPSTDDGRSSVAHSSPSQSWLNLSSDFAQRASYHQSEMFP